MNRETFDPAKLTSNPLALVRAFPTRFIAPELIHVPDGLPPDDIFLSKYVAFLTGRVPTHYTRASLERIRRGVWSRSGSEYILEGHSRGREDIEHLKTSIRLGSRPALHLYENPNKSDPPRWVCSDDVAAHQAYEELGIAVVPVVLMAKPRDTEESCVSVRNYRNGRKNHIALIEGVVPVEHALVPSVLGVERPALPEALELLAGALSGMRGRVRAFHRPGAVQFHYHHTLYSVLLRAEETVRSMLLLVRDDKVLVAASLLRPLYELLLTFYVDWLCPGHTYRYLQLASVMSEREWEKECDKTMREAIAGGVLASDAKYIRDANMRGFRLCSVVGEKARIYPLGEKYQRDIYSFLSDILHHDFSMSARYAFTLDHGDESIYVQDAQDSVAHVADLLVAGIVSRVQSDTGGENEALANDGAE
jgi:hypothetical protein